MAINYKLARKHLEAFDFKKLFVEVLGWGHGTGRPSTLTIDGAAYRLTPVAELGGMMVFQCEPVTGAGQPPMPARHKIERHVSQTAFEHVLIFTDRDHTAATWQWVKRGTGSSRFRQHTYTRGQPGDSLLQKLAGIAFELDELDEDGRVAIGVVTSRVTRVFDVEKVTKKFYDEFKGEHADFLKFLRGIPDEDDRAWYVSVMMNRLMFIYFVQKKGFLEGDPDYLQHKLAASKARGRDRFYRDFLVPLFFEGFAQEADKRSPEVRKLLGSVPYLNGGLFTPHDLEQKYGEAIAIPDAVFERRFAFFDKYTWHLDDRPWHVDNEINPDVLGFIFEKYINQKQMGAYYTKEDITGYICRNTILPFLLDKLGDRRYAAMNPLPLHDVEPYIYEAVKQAEYLPTETEREYAARQKRLEGIRADFAGGKIAAVNDLITYNLDIEAFVKDWLAELDDPVTLRAFYFECLRKLTVLDPTCGSGAFLFAAMNILEPLYERCLDRMAEFAGPRYPDFGEELARVARHPNRTYFVCKSIIVHNLYGVDIMEEAVEICKLRLFLKLVAQVDDGKKVEPLPDIDFNIRAGNTLVGYATEAEVQAAGSRSLLSLNLEEQIGSATRELAAFRDLQTRIDTPPGVMAAAKLGVREKLTELDGVLNEALANEYRMDVEPFAASHRPFHWYVQFHGIMREGGFDVIVGNPPYVEYKNIRDYKVHGFHTEACGDLYALVMERALQVSQVGSRLGFIVPMSCFSVSGFASLQSLYLSGATQLHVSNWSGDAHPSKLFEGVDKRLEIVLAKYRGEGSRSAYSSKYIKWYADERRVLFEMHPTYASIAPPATATHEHQLIPKISSDIEKAILAKLRSQRDSIASRMQASGPFSLYYTRKVSFFLQFLDFVPETRDHNGNLRAPSELKALYFATRADRDLCLAGLSTSLFYWYNIVHSDCRNLNKREVLSFPIPGAVPPHVQNQLTLMMEKLMASYRENSTLRTVTYAGQGNITVQYFNFRPSKPILDEIDRILARHYGLTDEELDFIINYDIKYRMGKDAAVE